MPFSSLTQRQVLLDLREQLQAAGYSAQSIDHHCATSRKFLKYIERRGIPIGTVQPANVVMYLRRELQRYKHRFGRMPRDSNAWRSWCLSGIVQMLRLIHAQWPPPRNAVQTHMQSLMRKYDDWLSGCRGLAASTVAAALDEVRRFLRWHNTHYRSDALADLSLSQVQQYLQMRAGAIRRTTLKAVSQRVSGFLRFLHRSGYVPADLSGRIIRPTLYEFESIPSVLRPQEMKQVLKTTRRDRSARGRRDYAILTLLATYGLRAGEIVRLALDDIDWRAETILIRHSKTRGTTLLPLLPVAAEALLGYLQHARPKTTSREVFIRMAAPLCGFSRGSSLYALVSRRLAAAGIRPAGKRGPHVFRHAHAVGLLRAAVPMKTISDLLGHRASRSTAIYLKLDSEELRAVALPLPNAGGAL